MKTFTLPGTEIVAPNVVLGLMRIADKTDDEVRELVAHGARRRHRLLRPRRRVRRRAARLRAPLRRGDAAHPVGARRDHAPDQGRHRAATGPTSTSPTSTSSSRSRARCAALQTDYIDILLLHRPDALVEPEEVARAFDELEAAGKVRAFGVSNHTPRQIDLLQKSVRQPIVANQLQLSITHAPIIAQGVAANMLDEEQSVDPRRRRHPRLLPAERHHRPGVVAVPGGLLQRASSSARRSTPSSTPSSTGSPRSTTCRRSRSRPRGSPAIPRRCRSCSAPRTRSASAGAAQGSDIPLTRAEWYELFRAAGHRVP